MAAENLDVNFYPIISRVYSMLNSHYDDSIRMINSKIPNMVDPYPGTTTINTPHLKFNSVILHNFKQKDKLTLNTRLRINEYFSDHYPVQGASIVNGQPIALKTFNLLRYGKLFKDRDMELRSPTVDVANTMAYVNQKIESQVAICLHYLRGPNQRVLALQECDFVVFSKIKSVANTIGYNCLFIPRQIDIRVLTPDSDKPVNYIDGKPNPFINTHGCAIFTKITGGSITTNMDDISDEPLEVKGHYGGNDIFYHRVLNTRTAYILNQVDRVGFISVHYEKYDTTIMNIVERLFVKYPNIEELFILGDFNRNIKPLLDSYDNKCNIIESGNIDHIISITRANFDGPPLPHPPIPPPPIPPEGPLRDIPPGIVRGYPPEPPQVPRPPRQQGTGSSLSTLVMRSNRNNTLTRRPLKLNPKTSKRANGQGGKPRKKRRTKRRRKH